MQPTRPTRQRIVNNLVIEIPKQEVSFLSAVIKDPFAKGSRLFGSTPLSPFRGKGLNERTFDEGVGWFGRDNFTVRFS
jgi:hypothetical protein